MPVNQDERLSFSTKLAAITSALYGLLIFFVTTFAYYLSPNFLSWVLAHMGVINGIYMLIEIWPIISQSTAPDKKEKLDVVTSPLSAAMVLLVTPAVYITKCVFTGWRWPMYYQWEIWINAIACPVVDLLLLLVLYRISRSLVRETRA